MDYDTPVYFSIDEVYRYIKNQNIATKDAKTGELKISSDLKGIQKEYQLFEEIEFESKVSGKINSGPYAGEFDRFIPRLETKLNDDRLAFLLQPRKNDKNEFKTED